MSAKTWHYAIQTPEGRSREYRSHHSHVTFEAAQDAAVRAAALGGKVIGTEVFLVRERPDDEPERVKLGVLSPIHQETAFIIS